ncbi:MAG: type II toxin-antitoxin system VapC family toxin [Propionibacteriaceae bacterium]|nr:type II toxin-antitoxin system VapC family toxin [Propionibacteriaceae bacterium]
MNTFVDTNILVRHLTGDPPDMARRATRFLANERSLVLADLVVAETVYVLESFYRVTRPRVAAVIRSLLAMPSIKCADPPVLFRALEVYELDRLDFAEAYLVARAEASGFGRVASFDRSIDRVSTVERVEPADH